MLAKAKPVLITAAIVVGVLAVLHLVAPASVKARLGIA